jgi:hypothetical protein
MPSKLSKARYKKSPKGKAVSKRYRQSAKGKAAHKRYRQSAKGKAAGGSPAESDRRNWVGLDQQPHPASPKNSTAIRATAPWAYASASDSFTRIPPRAREQKLVGAAPMSQLSVTT